MSITLKAWEQAKSAEVTKNEYPEFPIGRKIRTKVTELSCKFQDDDPEKPNFMLKFQTDDDKPIRGAKFYQCYDRGGVSQKTGKEWSADGFVDTQRMVQDIKTMGYELSEGDDVTIEDVMREISKDQPIVLLDSVKKGNYTNFYLNELVMYSNDQNPSTTEGVTEDVAEEVDEDPDVTNSEPDAPTDFIPNAGMIVTAKPGKNRKVEEYKVLVCGEDTCCLRRMRDKEVYEDEPFERVYAEIE